MQTLARPRSRRRINPFQRTFLFELFDTSPWPAPVNPEPRRPRHYVPTPEEIAAACELIQLEWTEEERCRRAGKTSRYTAPQAIDPAQKGGRNRRLETN